MSKNPVVHFEMPYNDKDRVSKFYEQAFGWEMINFGEEMGNYISAHTADTDEKNMVQQKGAINGGLFQRKPDSPIVPSVVIAVADIQVAMQDVVKAGGKVLGEPVNIPSVGLYVSFTDTEGNQVSILQPGR